MIEILHDLTYKKNSYTKSVGNLTIYSTYMLIQICYSGDTGFLSSTIGLARVVLLPLSRSRIPIAPLLQGLLY